MTGIYAIVNTLNGKRYIGQSVDVDKRIRNHFYCFKNGCHINSHLQHAYDKYGVGAFRVDVLCECDKEKLDDLEQYYIMEYESFSSKGYNLTAGGKGNLDWHPSQNTLDKNSVCVVLLNSCMVFNSIRDASLYAHTSQSSISYCCLGKTSYAGVLNGVPLVWDYKDRFDKICDKEKYTEDKIRTAVAMKNYENHYKISIVCLNNKMQFPSIKEAAIWSGSTISNIDSVILGKRKRAGRSADGKYYAWASYQQYLSMDDSDIQRLVDDANAPIRQGRSRAVECITSGEIFRSATYASKAKGVSQSSITMCCLGKLAHAGKDNITKQPLKWRYVVPNANLA